MSIKEVHTSRIERPDGVLFDCDSTLSSIEGIDELAAQSTHRHEIESLTRRAMEGEIPLEDVYEKRLGIIQPHRKNIEDVAAKYLATVTPGASEVIDFLKENGIRVGIVSGGIYQAILPLAEYLGVPLDDVHAVRLKFDDAGDYAGVEPSALTTANGKRKVVAQWKKAHNLKKVVLVGDGASDVAALPAAWQVIGYGGVVSRPVVERTATHFLREQNLMNILPIIGF